MIGRPPSGFEIQQRSARLRIERHGDPRGAEGLRHETCGSLLEAQWFCPTCARIVDENEEASPLLRA